MPLSRPVLGAFVDEYFAKQKRAKTDTAFQHEIRGVFIDEMVYGEVLSRYRSFLDEGPGDEADFMDTLPSRTMHDGTPLSLIREFSRHYFAQIYEILCKNKKRETIKKGTLGQTSIPVALSAWVMSHGGDCPSREGQDARN